MLENLPSWQIIGIVVLLAVVLTLIVERLAPKVLSSFGYERVKGALIGAQDFISAAERLLPDGTIPDLIARIAGTAVHAAEQLFEAAQGPQKYDYAERFIRDGLKASGVDNPDKYENLIRGTIEATVLLMQPEVRRPKAKAKKVTEPAPAMRADDLTQR